jgi:hypothetical protein
MHVVVHVIAIFGLLLATANVGVSQGITPPPRVEPPVLIPIEPVTPPPAAEPEKAAEPAPDLWTFAAEFSYTDQSGNKTLRLLTGGLKFSHRDRNTSSSTAPCSRATGRARARSSRATTSDR